MDSTGFYLHLRLMPDQFDHASKLHGLGHTYRVMVLVHRLCFLVKMESLAPAAIAAAYVHDMAREHDGYCTQHGRWAAQRKLPGLKEYFMEQGLSPVELEQVALAVEYHSLQEELPDQHPAWPLTALLKDADALDRIRLGESNLDTAFLRFPESKKLIGFARALYLSGRNTNFYNFAEALEFANQINQK